MTVLLSLLPARWISGLLSAIACAAARGSGSGKTLFCSSQVTRRLFSKKRRPAQQERNFMKNLLKLLEDLLVRILLFFISAYQRTLSPDHGFLNYYYGARRCHFFPSCSDYAKDSLRQYGLLKGLMTSFKRIARCNPWNAGGYDPVRDVRSSLAGERSGKSLRAKSSFITDQNL